MRYSLEPKYRKYVQDNGFLSFAQKFGDKYGKKLMDTATKTGVDAAKATGDLVGNKRADKITSVGKSKNKQEKMKQMK